MKNIIIINVAALLLSSVVTAQDRKIAVFDPAGSVDGGIKEVVREEISAVIVNMDGYTVLERQLINKVLEENKFQQGGLVDNSQVSAMGKHMGANLVFVSTITRLNNSYHISGKMIDVQTARIERQKTAKTQRGMDDLMVVVQELVGEMLGSTTKSAETPRQAGQSSFAPFVQPTREMLVTDGREVYYASGKELTEDEVRRIMANTDALQMYNKGVSRKKKGNICLITGGCLFVVGYALMMNSVASYDPYESNSSYNESQLVLGTLCGGIGVYTAIAGLIMRPIGKSNIRESINMYNYHGGRTSNAELRFGFTQNGVGLALNF